jgi:hypothetical protein
MNVCVTAGLIMEIPGSVKKWATRMHPLQDIGSSAPFEISRHPRRRVRQLGLKRHHFKPYDFNSSTHHVRLYIRRITLYFPFGPRTSLPVDRTALEFFP